MEITNIRVRKLFPDGKMKMIVSVTFDDAFVIHEIKVVEGSNGLFVAMPSRRNINGEFRDIAHPISKAAREMIQTEVMSAYQQALDEFVTASVSLGNSDYLESNFEELSAT